MQRSHIFFLQILLGFILMVYQGYAQVSIQARLDRAEMKTGEQAVIDVIIRTDDLARTRFYLAEDPQRKESFVLLEFTPIDTVTIEGGLKEITARMIISSFDSTLISIPSIVVETPSGRSKTEPLALNVIQPEVDADSPENFKPIKTPWSIETRLRDFIEPILSNTVPWVLIIVLIVIWSMYTYRKSPKIVQEAVHSPEVTMSPLQKAELSFDDLEHSGCLERQEYKEYYTNLIYTIKAYMDEARGWTTLEKTSDEVMNILEQDMISYPLLSSARAILWEADMSKFAQRKSTQDSAKKSLHTARMFVREADRLWGSMPESNKAEQGIPE